MEDNKKIIISILELINEYPNDYDLGRKVRELIKKNIGKEDDNRN